MCIYVYVSMCMLEHVQAFSILWQRQQLDQTRPDQANSRFPRVVMKLEAAGPTSWLP